MFLFVKTVRFTELNFPDKYPRWGFTIEKRKQFFFLHQRQQLNTQRENNTWVGVLFFFNTFIMNTVLEWLLVGLGKRYTKNPRKSY